MKIVAGMICFNSMPFIEGAIETIYPFVSQILVVEGPVRYWQEKGFSHSTDGTIEVVQNLADRDDKITLIRGQWEEKDEQSNAWLDLVEPDTDYIWQVDPDEFYLSEDIEKILGWLRQGYSVIGFQWYDFVEFKKATLNTKVRNRIWKWKPESGWKTTRPPYLLRANGQFVYDTERVLAGHIAAEHGVRMLHYSHIFEHQIAAREAYYDYRGIYYIPQNIVNKGVQYTGKHPKWIVDNEDQLRRKYGDA